MRIDLDDRLSTPATFRASRVGLSLSGWVSHLVSRELAQPAAKKFGSLLEALADPVFSDIELDLKRDKTPLPPLDF
ncbi:MAG: hypothetical protein ABIS50_03845 [Luteolibacter sp.]|uniref:hypothetical protein n=1 Tax=Luteolibacter sp. TaxID=1962973 RepID=UPI0032673121